MQLSGITAYGEPSPVGNAVERSVPDGRDGRGAASSTSGRQAGDSVTISPQARSKADEEKIKREVEELKRDEERVKAHEAAHKAAGGQYAGAVSYSYRPGPDGRNYIVGGEVQIDIAPERTPQETVSKMQVVIRAAMAPADPSGQDRAVAAQAAAQMAEAQVQQATEGEETTVANAGEASAAPQQAGSTRGDAGAPDGHRSGAVPPATPPPFSTYG